MEGTFFNLAQIAAADFGFIRKVILRKSFRILYRETVSLKMDYVKA